MEYTFTLEAKNMFPVSRDFLNSKGFHRTGESLANAMQRGQERVQEKDLARNRGGAVPRERK